MSHMLLSKQSKLSVTSLLRHPSKSWRPQLTSVGLGLLRVPASGSIRAASDSTPPSTSTAPSTPEPVRASPSALPEVLRGQFPEDEACSPACSSNQSARQHHQWLGAIGLAVLGGTTLLLTPGPALASETLSGSALVYFQQFLEHVESLGPWGGLLFVLTVMVAEMIPLFPTQPLSLASGILFGPQKGAALVLLGATLAALNAFLIARGVGRPLAQKVIDAEMGGEGSHGDGGVMKAKLAEVQAAIESGGFWKQLTAITLLRLTPVVPFSASNYLLGLTPVQLPAFLGGTLAGMIVWSIIYASLGGASRKLLDRGADIGVLLSELAERSSQYTSSVATISLVAGGAAAAAWGITQMRKGQQRQAGGSGEGVGAGSNGDGGQSTSSSSSLASRESTEEMARQELLQRK